MQEVTAGDLLFLQCECERGCAATDLAAPHRGAEAALMQQLKAKQIERKRSTRNARTLKPLRRRNEQNMHTPAFFVCK